MGKRITMRNEAIATATVGFVLVGGLHAAFSALSFLAASPQVHGAAAPSQGGALRGIRREPRGDLEPTIDSADSSLAGGALALLVAGGCAAQAISRRARGDALQLRATRTDWYRRVKRLPNDLALFDVKVKKPMGLKMEIFPQKDKVGIGISEVVEDGNASKLNREVCVNDLPGMWVLEGDQVLAVNGEDVEEGTIEDIVRIVTSSTEPEITLTLCRNTRKGPIKVVMMPDADMVTVRRSSRLSAAAEYCAGKELTYGCIDGWCGTCWHREKYTNGVFKPCCDVLTGDWDNVMPLVLTPKPEKAGDSSYTYLKPRGL